ncbi:SLC13/DASS family transporter [Luteolibacter pohnpeiensis]|uniref:SLC13/DASS family transporter n=1 Tax=Luteolibacter pohnpeiensis TaxID=454153 RepID=A0A934S8V8_9BACT|nr:DASS family sodium-coupled anion symporter [Luteolibacter pohnpeiensis]MBK1880968.1 SLC13/DASS family transporter [Luteolibacter pohnpeiensis]
MKKQDADELLARVLGGKSSEEDRASLLDWLAQNQDQRSEAAEQLVIDSLLGVTLEKNSGDDFRDRLLQRLALEQERRSFQNLGARVQLNSRKLGFILGPLLATISWFLLHFLLADAPAIAGKAAPACWAGAVLIWCVVWWIFEPVPIAATSLIPLALFPLFGVLDEVEIADSYANHLVILFLSGFMLSRAMEQSGAHRRLALGLVRMIGGSGGRPLVLACMIASAGLSMWTSNTVTVLILLPIVIAIIDQRRDRQLATPLLLGIAYAAAIGGIASPIGTPPNAVLIAQADLLVAAGQLAHPVGFVDWVKFGLPVSLILVPLAWLWLTRGILPAAPFRIAPLGPWRKAEVRVSLVLGLTAVLWMTRSDPYGGWSSLLGVPTLKDSTVGLLAVIALFLIPNGNRDGKNLLEWEHAAKIPWNVLILLGSGIAIGNAIAATGLSQAIAENLNLLGGLSTLPMVVVVVIAVSLLTEIGSNTATSTILLPLLAATALAAQIPPMLLMVPAAMATSCSFLLPVATPPNAVVFAVGEFSIRRMLFEGMVLKAISAVVIIAVCYLMMA